MNKEKKETWEFVSTQVMGYLIIIGFFAVLITLIVMGKWDIVTIMVGSLITAFVALHQFKWGSSQSSADKTKALIDNQQKLTS